MKEPGAQKAQTSNNCLLQKSPKTLNPKTDNNALFKLIEELQDQVRSLQEDVRSNQDQIAQLQKDKCMNCQKTNNANKSHNEKIQKGIEAIPSIPEKMPPNSRRFRKSQDKELQRESEQLDLSFFKNLDTYNYSHQPGL